MNQLLIHAVISGFLIALPPGFVHLIAFERTLNHSLKAGWLVALGATGAHMVYAGFAAAGFAIAGEWWPLSGFADVVNSNKLLLLWIVGIFILLSGIAFFFKPPSKPKAYVGTSFVLGLSLSLANISNLATHSTAISLEGGKAFTGWEIPIVIIGVAIGAHVSWSWKIIAVWLGKKQLMRWSVENFNRVFGWFMIILAALVLSLAGLITAGKEPPQTFMNHIPSHETLIHPPR